MIPFQVNFLPKILNDLYLNTILYKRMEKLSEDVVETSHRDGVPTDSATEKPDTPPIGTTEKLLILGKEPAKEVLQMINERIDSYIAASFAIPIFLESFYADTESTPIPGKIIYSNDSPQRRESVFNILKKALLTAIRTSEILANSEQIDLYLSPTPEADEAWNNNIYDLFAMIVPTGGLRDNAIPQSEDDLENNIRHREPILSTWVNNENGLPLPVFNNICPFHNVSIVTYDRFLKALDDVFTLPEENNETVKTDLFDDERRIFSKIDPLVFNELLRGLLTDFRVIETHVVNEEVSGDALQGGSRENRRRIVFTFFRLLSTYTHSADLGNGLKAYNNPEKKHGPADFLISYAKWRVIHWDQAGYFRLFAQRVNGSSNVPIDPKTNKEIIMYDLNFGKVRFIGESELKEIEEKRANPENYEENTLYILNVCEEIGRSGMANRMHAAVMWREGSELKFKAIYSSSSHSNQEGIDNGGPLKDASARSWNWFLGMATYPHPWYLKVGPESALELHPDLIERIEFRLLQDRPDFAGFNVSIKKMYEFVKEHCLQFSCSIDYYNQAFRPYRSQIHAEILKLERLRREGDEQIVSWEEELDNDAKTKWNEIVARLIRNDYENAQADRDLFDIMDYNSLKNALEASLEPQIERVAQDANLDDVFAFFQGNGGAEIDNLFDRIFQDDNEPDKTHQNILMLAIKTFLQKDFSAASVRIFREIVSENCQKNKTVANEQNPNQQLTTGNKSGKNIVAQVAAFITMLEESQSVSLDTINILKTFLLESYFNGSILKENYVEALDLLKKMIQDNQTNLRNESETQVLTILKSVDRTNCQVNKEELTRSLEAAKLQAEGLKTAILRSIFETALEGCIYGEIESQELLELSQEMAKIMPPQNKSVLTQNWFDFKSFAGKGEIFLKYFAPWVAGLTTPAAEMLRLELLALLELNLIDRETYETGLSIVSAKCVNNRANSLEYPATIKSNQRLFALKSEDIDFVDKYRQYFFSLVNENGVDANIITLLTKQLEENFLISNISLEQYLESQKIVNDYQISASVTPDTGEEIESYRCDTDAREGACAVINNVNEFVNNLRGLAQNNETDEDWIRILFTLVNKFRNEGRITTIEDFEKMSLTLAEFMHNQTQVSTQVFKVVMKKMQNLYLPLVNDLIREAYILQEAKNRAIAPSSSQKNQEDEPVTDVSQSFVTQPVTALVGTTEEINTILEAMEPQIRDAESTVIEGQNNDVEWPVSDPVSEPVLETTRSRRKFNKWLMAVAAGLALSGAGGLYLTKREWPVPDNRQKTSAAAPETRVAALKIKAAAPETRVAAPEIGMTPSLISNRRAVNFNKTLSKPKTAQNAVQKPLYVPKITPENMSPNFAKLFTNWIYARTKVRVSEEILPEIYGIVCKEMTGEDGIFQDSEKNYELLRKYFAKAQAWQIRSIIRRVR